MKINDCFNPKELSSTFWECISYYPSSFGGRIYQFIPRAEYDDLTPVDRLFHIVAAKSKYEEIYPTLEPSLSLVTYLNEDDQMIQDACAAEEEFKEYYLTLFDGSPELTVEWENYCRNMPKKLKQMRVDFAPLREIGYRLIYSKNNGIDLSILELPDLETIKNGWQFLQNKYPEMHLSDLDLVECNETLNDRSFMKAYLKHDALLSTGKEFVHDQFSHVLARLELMLLKKENYSRIMRRVRYLISKLYNAISEKAQSDPSVKKEWDKFTFMVGILCEIVFSYQKEIIETFDEKWMDEMLSNLNPNLDHLIISRFGEEWNAHKISNLWKKSSIKLLV